MLTFTALCEALRAAGISAGDTVHVQSDLRRIGAVEAEMTAEAVSRFYFDAFMEVLGPEGTLTVSTAFEDYGRFGVPYDRENSPSRGGIFSEYVRTRPGAVRSMHPIASVSGVGPLARDICGWPHYDAYGYDTPWGQIHRRNVKVMTLGLGANLGGLSLVHYVERLFGVPYQYTKIFTHPVIADGVPQPGPFTMSVRYLDYGIVDTSVRIKQRMVAEGTAVAMPLGRGAFWIARAQDLVDTTIEALRTDRWVLLEQPPKFRPGEMPMDGTTGPMRVLYDQVEGEA
ncbi:MAG TPA: AAC(3) family N-acetyltransferase [Azospirillum sp.]